jgi:hypothetical protein
MYLAGESIIIITKQVAIENKQSIPFIAAVIHVFSLTQTLIS